MFFFARNAVKNLFFQKLHQTLRQVKWLMFFYVLIVGQA